MNRGRTGAWRAALVLAAGAALLTAAPVHGHEMSMAEMEVRET